MTSTDDYGIVTRNAEVRALYGNRVCHGKVAHVATLPEAPQAPVKRAPIIWHPPPQPRNRITKRIRPEPDVALAAAIRDAYYRICKDRQPNHEERSRLRQGAVYLIYHRANVLMLDIAAMWGLETHGSIGRDLKAVGKRLCQDGAKPELARHKMLMEEAKRPLQPPAAGL